MQLQQVPIDTLVLDPTNARLHNDRNKDSVRASIKEFGQVEVLVVQKGTNRVIGGNCRLQEMRRLGHDKVWIAEVDVDDKKANKLALALNRTGELAQWDDEMLGKLLGELETEGDLSGIGWSDVEMDKILSDVEAGWLDDVGQAEPEKGADNLAAGATNVDGEGSGGEELVNPGLGRSTITATIVFDDDAQQKRFRKFVRWCRKTYPTETMSASLDLHIQGVGNEQV